MELPPAGCYTGTMNKNGADQIKRAVLDVDGVLLDCSSAFIRVASEVTGRSFPLVRNAYDFCHRYGLSEDEVQATYEAMRDDEHGWSNLAPLPGAVDAFCRLQRYGYQLHLVTAIPETLKSHRARNLARHGMRPHAIHCAGSARAGKSDIIRQIDPIMFVDDRLSHLNEADFVEHRVLVDCGIDQEGHVACDRIVSVSSLADWVDTWSLRRGYENPSIHATGRKP